MSDLPTHTAMGWQRQMLPSQIQSKCVASIDVGDNGKAHALSSAALGRQAPSLETAAIAVGRAFLLGPTERVGDEVS